MPTQKYLLNDGTECAGVTTIIGILDKSGGLMHWAWELGKQGKDYRKERNKAADVGTIAHYLAECEMTGQKPDLSQYPPNLVEKAEIAFIGFLDFRKRFNIKPIKNEIALVSNKYGYGGCIDIYAEIEGGKKVLLDLKTSKGLYPEMKIQVAAYRNLLEENEYPVDEVHILQINKETGDFIHHPISNLDNEWALFKALIPVYKLWKSVKRKNGGN